MPDIEELLLKRLTDQQRDAVKSGQRRVLVVAGGRIRQDRRNGTRIAWWLAVEGVPALRPANVRDDQPARADPESPNMAAPPTGLLDRVCQAIRARHTQSSSSGASR